MLDVNGGILWGKVLGLPDQISITFEGQTVQALRQDLERAVAPRDGASQVAHEHARGCGRTGRSAVVRLRLGRSVRSTRSVSPVL